MEYSGEIRPWGEFITLSKNIKSTVKILKVNKGAKLSIQSHDHRDELWYVLDGDVDILTNNKWINAKKGDMFFIKRNNMHSIQGNETSRILEISFGIFKEKDIRRFSDIYGRT